MDTERKEKLTALKNFYGTKQVQCTDAVLRVDIDIDNDIEVFVTDFQSAKILAEVRRNREIKDLVTNKKTNKKGV